MERMRPIYGRPRYGLTLRDLEPDEAVRRDDLEIVPFAVRHRGVALRLRAVRGRAARPLRRRARRAARRDARARTSGACSAARSSTACVRSRSSARRGAGARSSSPATPRRRTPSSSPRIARTCSSTRRRSCTRTPTARPRPCHSTARQAAQVAADAEVGLLALTHLSSRYSGGEIRDEARAVFADTEVPRDFDTIDLPLPERGPPELVRWDARRHRRRPRRGSTRRPERDPANRAGSRSSA